MRRVGEGRIFLVKRKYDSYERNIWRFKMNDMTVRPFLTQSDSASRKRPFSTGLSFDWILLVLLLIVSRVNFIVFVLFLEAVGVREYCCVTLETRLAALCLARS